MFMPRFQRYFCSLYKYVFLILFISIFQKLYSWALFSYLHIGLDVFQELDRVFANVKVYLRQEKHEKHAKDSEPGSDEAVVLFF